MLNRNHWSIALGLQRYLPWKTLAGNFPLSVFCFRSACPLRQLSWFSFLYTLTPSLCDFFVSRCRLGLNLPSTSWSLVLGFLVLSILTCSIIPLFHFQLEKMCTQFNAKHCAVRSCFLNLKSFMLGNTQRATNVHQQTRTSQWAETSKKWQFFSAAHMCSLLVPSVLSHSWKRSAKKLHYCTFTGIRCMSESAKKLQKLFGSALSHLISHRRLDFGLGDSSRGPQDAENGVLVVHQCWCTLGALLSTENYHL